jgi:hypothetical protein
MLCDDELSIAKHTRKTQTAAPTFQEFYDIKVVPGGGLLCLPK